MEEIAGIAIIPLIIGIIEAVKRFFPNAHRNVWFGLSLLLGIAGRVVALLIANEGQFPATFVGWAGLIVLGLAFGLASGKAYDETLGKP